MDGGGAGFLGVERSLCGREWRLREADERLALALAQRLGLPEVLARILAARGIGLDAAPGFLEPRLRDLLPDPSAFKDMDAAAGRLAAAIRGGETIAIFGDYDVDGATSAALLQRFCEAAGGRVLVYIPDRRAEGYGPNLPALLRLREAGARVIVTVDCGTTAHEPLAGAAAAGLDLIVVDHHVAEPKLPPAFAVINPNRLDESGAHGELAAVGVAFLLAVAVNRALRAAGWYQSGRTPPDLLQWLDLVALGTICDVVPLTGVNRALAAQGLKVMQRRGNPGIAALAEVARIDERLDAYHAAFLLGPRVNAGGRVGCADLGARLLASDDPAAVAGLARRLDAFNAERREIEARVLAEAIAAVETAPSPAPLAFAAGEGWHPGVIGIVAGRLKERYNRPSCVVALADGIGKGSGRSVAGVALGAAIIAARQEGLLLNGGGHAMAAGFTVAADKLAALRDFLAERIGAEIGSDGLVPRLAIDGALTPGAANATLLDLVERLAPFGAGNAEPRFVFPGARLLYAEPVGGQHVRCTLADAGGGGRLRAIAFRCLDGPLGRALLDRMGGTLHIAGHLRRDRRVGEGAVQLQIEDAAPAAA
ncbi:MAG TPA: single-stranded-DNA-specific exonuclease RecJ [Stellaceae bacterium]|nr:single-stranded-DNA-specific exonuclease RecJ [Stellaceae bacterium]